MDPNGHQDTPTLGNRARTLNQVVGSTPPGGVISVCDSRRCTTVVYASCVTTGKVLPKTTLGVFKRNEKRQRGRGAPTGQIYAMSHGMGTTSFQGYLVSPLRTQEEKVIT